MMNTIKKIGLRRIAWYVIAGVCYLGIGMSLRSMRGLIPVWVVLLGILYLVRGNHVDLPIITGKIIHALEIAQRQIRTAHERVGEQTQINADTTETLSKTLQTVKLLDDRYLELESRIKRLE